MEYSITTLTEEKLIKNYNSLIETLENLKPTWRTNLKKLIEFFREMEKTSKTYIAELENWEIIWTIKLLVEYKLNRWWVIATKIEDLAVKKWFEWLKIWSKLIEKALEYSKEKWAYKVTLSCKKELEWFYEKFWIKPYSINMKKYL